jgi:Zn-dependent peptidase ImmA (M78 family)/transcriptional regulator with XRE-family HTH domain
VAATDDWEDLRQTFDGNQLRIARELRRMTQAELARSAVEAGHPNGLTATAVSQFELGAAVPTVVTLKALVAALKIDATFLSYAAVDDEANLPAFFRSLRSTPAQERKYARNVVQLVHRLAVVLDQHVGLPPRDVPRIPCDPFDDADVRRAAAEDAARAVRKAWRIDRGPVADVVRTIESHGIVCTRLLFRDERVDAFSVNFSDHPVAVLATDKDKWDRSRFDAAHELGHLVMHDEAAGVPEAERQAHEFAAAFLMPARDVQDVLPAHADWRRLMDLKNEWGVSIAALLMRARTLGIMAETTYVSATKMMSARGWRRHEPVDGTPETPALLHDALARSRRRHVAAEELRREAAIPLDIFEEVCQLI